jgi:exopolysaccharide biosynthesis polyprenyl glycosylphosphotransferase
MRRIADFAVVLLSFAIAYVLYFHDGRYVPYGLGQFLELACVAGLIFLSVFHFFRLYESETSLLNVVETRRLFLGWVFGSLLLQGASFYSRFLDLSRLMLTVALGISFLLLVIERSIFYRISISLHLRGRAIRPAVIFGAGVVGKHLFKRIHHSPALGLYVLGFLDDDPKLWGTDVHIGELLRRRDCRVLGGLDQVRELQAKENLREVFVAMPTASYARNLEVVEACKRMGMAVTVVPPTYGQYLHSLEVRDIGGIPVLRQKNFHRPFFYPFFKRIFDVIVSLLAILLLSPVFLLVAIFIRLDSEGPVLFRQKRIGSDGKEFDFFKFRSMYVSANPYGITPKEFSDPRITKLGRYLRRSSLDELPQFFNVLRGDMSIVGPRPEMPFIVATYTEEQRERLKVKPGITGVWQISAVRGEPIHANLEYDLFYIEHQSLLLDVIIMVKTIGTAIRGIGAF